MVMRKLDWTASSAFHVQTAEGTTIDLRTFPPHSLDKLVKRSVERALWR